MEMKNAKLLCFSDSIGTNYKLKVRTNTFSELLGRRLEAEEICNYSKPAFPVGELINLLKDDKVAESVRKAGVIVVCCGSNNLISNGRTMTRMALAAGVEPSWRMTTQLVQAIKKNPLNAAKMVKALTSEDAKRDIEYAVETFKNEMPVFIENLKKLNKDAVILMMTLYTFTDVSRSPIYKATTKILTGITNKVNDWMKETYADDDQVIVVDLAGEMRKYDGEEELSNLKENDFHLSDAGHAFAYRLLYDSLVAAYPEFACEEKEGVFHERKRKETDEKVYQGTSKYSDQLKKITERVIDAPIEGYDDNKQYVQMNISLINCFDITREVEKEFFNGEETVILPPTAASYLRPTFFLDYIEGRNKDSVLNHLDELPHYASREEKEEAEKNDSEIMKILKSCITDRYLHDDMIVLNRDTTFFDSLKMNYLDWERCLYFSEMTLNIELLIAKTPDPEKVTLGEIEDYAAKIVDPKLLNLNWSSVNLTKK